MTATDSITRRKDSPALDTIARARTALARIGVWLYEASWCNPVRGAFSARVCDAAWPDDAAVGVRS